MALILLAEDDAALAVMLQELLDSRGHHTIIAKDGMAASIMAQDIKPALIVCDIMMPGVYGTSTYKSLESAGLVPKTPVIFITSLAIDRARLIVPDNPRTRLFGKPLDIEGFLGAVRELLS